MFANKTVRARLVCGIALAIVFCFFAKTVTARTTLSYVPSRELVKQIVLENEAVRYILEVDKTSVKLAGIIDKESGTDYMAGHEPLQFLAAKELWGIRDVGYHRFTFDEEEIRDGVSVSISQKSVYSENYFKVTQTNGGCLSVLTKKVSHCR